MLPFIHHAITFDPSGYSSVKTELDANGKPIIAMSSLNGSPVISITHFDPKTGLPTTSQLSVDIAGAKSQIANLQAQIDNINQYIADATAVQAKANP